MLHPAQIDHKSAFHSTTTSNLLVTRIARSVTHLTAPPVLSIPVYIFLETLYDPQHEGTGWKVTLALFFGAVAPAIAVLLLKALKLVSDVHIMERTQRTLPYCIAIASFGLGTLTLWLLYGWGMMSALLACCTLNTLTVMLINLRWKISAHATGVSGSIAACLLIVGWRAWPLLGLLALVAWARIYLRAHTPGQVVSGSLLGFSFTVTLLTLCGSLI